MNNSPDPDGTPLVCVGVVVALPPLSVQPRAMESSTLLAAAPVTSSISMYGPVMLPEALLVTLIVWEESPAVIT